MFDTGYQTVDPPRNEAKPQSKIDVLMDRKMKLEQKKEMLLRYREWLNGCFVLLENPQKLEQEKKKVDTVVYYLKSAHDLVYDKIQSVIKTLDETLQ